MAVVFGASTSAYAGSILDELSADQQNQLRSDKLVVVTQDMPGYAWPTITVYHLIHATPEEVMAVNIDYELRRNYIPDLTKARISKVVDPRTTEVDYTLGLPVLGPENFTLRHEISTYDNGASYRMDLHLVRADRTKTSDAWSRMEALGSDTVFTTKSFVDPGNPLASIIKNRAIKQAGEAADGFVAQVEREVKQQPEVLAAQIKKLRTALGRKPR